MYVCVYYTLAYDLCMYKLQPEQKLTLATKLIIQLTTKSTTKRQTTQLKKWEKYLNKHFSKENIQWPICT